MADIDDFATSLLEEAKRFLEKADGDDVIAQTAYSHAALMLAFSSLEAHLNAISEELAVRPEFSLHEKGLLLEKEIRLVNGEFELGGLRMSRLEDRILYLRRHFSGEPLDKAQAWWSQLMNAINTRNRLTHPKDVAPVNAEQVKAAVEAVIDTIDHLYQIIYKRRFPAATLGLHSRFAF